MPIDFVSSEEKKKRVQKRDPIDRQQKDHPSTRHENPVSQLQNQIGNRAVQRLLVQRSASAPYQLDEATAARINQARSGGQALDANIQKSMGEAFNADFRSVQVHTDAEAHNLNENLSARAFTTGSDIFFREGEYNPNTSSGQELIAHELTHVVQQSTGQVENGSGMTVNAPGDQFEQEADSAAKALSGSILSSGVQRQELEEDEVQMNGEPEEEEEELQTQAMPEEEEPIQTRRDR